MMRRRIERLGRSAFQVAHWCQGDTQGFPLIFASRHGDPGRTADLLLSMWKNEPLSPTSFTLSVHNAIGAQYSIVRGETSNVSAISNGIFTIEAALVEAVALLSDGHAEVMVVVYDASLPALYLPFADEPQADFAFAWRIKAGNTFSLESSSVSIPQLVDALPHALGVLRFFLGTNSSFEFSDCQAGWKWNRHA